MKLHSIHTHFVTRIISLRLTFTALVQQIIILSSIDVVNIMLLDITSHLSAAPISDGVIVARE